MAGERKRTRRTGEPKAPFVPLSPSDLVLVEGFVDRARDHFVVEWHVWYGQPVARIQSGGERLVVFEFLPDAQTLHANQRKMIWNEVHRVLVQRGGPDPWKQLHELCAETKVGNRGRRYRFIPGDSRGGSFEPTDTETSSRVGEVMEPRRVLRLKDRTLVLYQRSGQPCLAIFDAGGLEGSAEFQGLGFSTAEARARWARHNFPGASDAMDWEAARLAACLGEVEQWIDAGEFDRAFEKLAELAEALEALAGEGRALLPLASCRLLRGRLAWKARDWSVAIREFRDALEAARWGADAEAAMAGPLVVEALASLGQVLATRDGPAAEAFLVQAIETARADLTVCARPDAARRLASVLAWLSDVRAHAGDQRQAISLLKESFRLVGVSGDDLDDHTRAGVLGVLERLGDHAFLRKEYSEARDWYLKYLDHAVRINDQGLRARGVIGSCARLTDACLALDDIEAAERYSCEALRIAGSQEVGPGETRRSLADALARRGAVLCRRHDIDGLGLLARSAGLWADEVRNSGRPEDLFQETLSWQLLAQQSHALGGSKAEVRELWARAIQRVEQLQNATGRSYERLLADLRSEAGDLSVGAD
ncbi:MAG: hypothetical protein FJ087_10760 [Deltaproteobacteria bacterium]|nr:hypothetical protein [Deltaproteobacteria bacterium]